MRFATLSRVCASLAAIVLVSSCEMVTQINDGMAHSTAAATAIEKQVGVKPEVGFNFQNGTFSQATVQFRAVPATPLPQLEKIVREAVALEFKDEPSALVIAFTYEKARP
jgi:hypothetical protein